MPASDDPDAWLWVAMVAIGYYAAWGIGRQLWLVRHAVRITKSTSPPDMISKATEDEIKLKTLEQLTQSSNYDIREACIKILKQRAALSQRTWKTLGKLLQSKRETDQKKALTILRFLLEFPYGHWPPEMSSSFIRCLQNLLPTAWTAWHNSDYLPERHIMALEILNQVPIDAFHPSLQDFLESGLVRDWLSKYPLMAHSAASQKSIQPNYVWKLSKQQDGEKCHPAVLSQILEKLIDWRAGRDEMKRYGLYDDACAVEEQIILHEPRIAEESPEEMQLRRRRREAIVLGEEGRSLRREDIIQRGEEVRDEEVEEELEQLWNEVMRAQGGLPRASGWWDWFSRLRPHGIIHPDNITLSDIEDEVRQPVRTDTPT